MKIFINFVKKSLIKGRIRGEIEVLRGIRALKKIKALLQPILNLFARF